MSISSHMVRSVALLFVLVLVGIWALRPPPAVTATIADKSCEHVEVRNQAGQRVTGIEDLALGPGGTLVFSAYDRLDPQQGDGALYMLDLFGLSSGAGQAARRISVTPGRSFRPHGFAIAPGGARLAVINRPKNGDVEILTGPFDGEAWYPNGRIGHPSLCRANDLDYADGSDGTALHVTIDRGSCGFSPADLVPWAKTGSVILADNGEVRIVRRGLSFPNGIRGKMVAETRGKRLSHADSAVIALPGGPDNITEARDGRLIVAVHPKLIYNWFAQQGWVSNIPSRILAVDVARRNVTVLFDDVSGTLYSGATAAVVSGGTLVAGSATDHGLLVCRL